MVWLPFASASWSLLGSAWQHRHRVQDLPGSLSETQVAEELGLGKVAARPHRVQPVSATTGAGVADGLQWLVSAVKASPRLSLLRRKMRSV